MIANGADDGRLVATSFEARQSAASVPFPSDLPPTLAEGLRRAGIESLYAHQNEALGESGQGNVISTSGTASGKSLSFNLPVLETLALDPKSRALYLYPTKALAQDQARKLSALQLPYLRHAIYDGDTPREDRPGLRRRSNLILTNPDMVNVGLLPHHQGWGDFIANLRWIVVDEAHTYRGVFGSHVANVLRRLRRVARLYRAEPRFLLASATIANPGELAERLVGEPVSVASSDGAPRAGRRIVMWNPPVIDERTQRRRSTLSEGAELLADLVTEGMRTICFLRSRKGIELILRFARLRLEERGREDLAARIAPYRAGYTPQQRREIEHRLVTGDLLGVVATDALELGIDIGELDASICVTFPGTVASLRQMWGRAGRRTQGLAVYVAGEDALDQFFCRHPDEFLGRPVEAAILDHQNPHIQTGHVLAAAHEAPLGGTASQPGGADDAILGEGWRDRADDLVAAGELRQTNDRRYVPRDQGFAAGRISLRSASLDSVAVIDSTSGEMLGTVEAERAFSTIHPGAVYLHMGRSYEVRELDVDGRRAIVEPFDGDWYTQPKKETNVYIDEIPACRRQERRQGFGWGTLNAPGNRVVLRERRRLRAGDRLPAKDGLRPGSDRPHRAQPARAELPDASALVCPPGRARRSRGASGRGATRSAPRRRTLADRRPAAVGDVRSLGHRRALHQRPLSDRRPTIFIYDGHPGGVGIAERGFERFPELVGNALRLVSECPCASGCPSCVQSPKCGNLNEPLHKAGAIELMGGILGRREAGATAQR